MELQKFPAFYRTNVERIYRFLYFRVGGNAEVAEDLTQDVFLKAYQAFESYDPAISASSWIYTIARNHLINHIQKTRQSVSLEEIEETVWHEEFWEQKLVQQDDQRRLMEALRTLPEADREMIRLRHLEGWSYEELAEKMGKTAGALRIQVHRILKVLQGILKH